MEEFAEESEDIEEANYDETNPEDLLDDDELSLEEAAFMEGYEKASKLDTKED